MRKILLSNEEILELKRNNAICINIGNKSLCAYFSNKKEQFFIPTETENLYEVLELFDIVGYALKYYETKRLING